jgi:hypothetical protein
MAARAVNTSKGSQALGLGLVASAQPSPPGLGAGVSGVEAPTSGKSNSN